MPAASRKIGEFTVIKELGRGGMGAVYLAEDPKLMRRVAIKTFRHESGTNTSGLLERFKREAVAQARLQHPNIVSVYSYGEQGDLFYLVMPFVDGTPLSDLLRNGRMPLEMVRTTLRDVAAALDHAHGAGVIHRDLKPSNIMITRDGAAQLMDFGIARLTSDLDVDSKTIPGFILGTPNYISPEAIRGEEVGPPADIFGLGIVVYEMLCGKRPFSATSAPNLMFAILSADPEPVRLARPDADEALASAVHRALEKEPGRRFQSAGEFYRAAVGGKTTGETIATPPPPPSPSLEQPEVLLPSPGSATVIMSLDASFPDPRQPVRGLPPVGEATVMFRQPAAQAPVPPRVQLVVIASKDPGLKAATIPVPGFPFRIGRSECDLQIGDPALSRVHVILESEEGGFFIRDAGSSNGTYLDGRRLPVNRSVVLPFGATIRLSPETALSFQMIETAPLPDLSGTAIENRYKLVRLLRAGSKSALYEATDTKLGQQIAVKVLHPQIADTPGYLRQFEREAKTAAGLSHSAICSVHDFGSTSISPPSGPPFRTHYLCMKLMEGGSLAGKLEQGESIRPDDCLRWSRRIAEALEAAHADGIVHGGIKPSSIVFDRFGQAYLADFATASRLGGENGGTILGAPSYLAPEQWDDKEATPQTDQYSFAAVVYRTLTGEPAFEGQEYPEVRRRNYARGPVAAHDLAAQNKKPDIPRAVSGVLARALAVSPEERFASVADFHSALETAVTKPPPAERTRPRVFISYRREASAGWPNLFSAVLRDKFGIDSFLDVQGLDHAGRFPEQIRRNIADSDAFVCFVNTETLKSDWVRQELQFAHQRGKPLIPVLHEGFERLPAEVPREPWVNELFDSQGVKIFDLQNLYIDAAIHQLATLIQTARG